MKQKSETSHAVLNEASRYQKAEKIVSILADQTDLKNATVLDIGTGAGYITHSISRFCKKMESVDLYDERIEKSGYNFTQVDSEKLPFEDNFFDIVITNHVIEHVPDQQLHVNEAYRVLKKGGTVYLATPNKFWLTDPHYKLPFISWLPRKWAGTYLKLVKKKEWDIYPLSYREVRELARHKFSAKYVTLEVVKNPEEYDLATGSPVVRIVKLVPESMLSPLKRFVPTHIFLFQKD